MADLEVNLGRVFSRPEGPSGEGMGGVSPPVGGGSGVSPRENFEKMVQTVYTKFQFKMSIWNGDNEWKLKINGIFLSPRGITLPKIIQPDPNLNSTCIFSWQTYVPNFIWKSPCMTKIMSGNWIRNDGRTEWRKDRMTERGNTICPSHFMAGA